MGCRIILVIVLLDVVLIMPALSQKEDRASSLESAGEDLFLAGKYKEALQVFQEVVREYKEPIDVVLAAWWNIGRCYEQLGDDESALSAFEEFKKRAVSDDERKDAHAKIAEVRARLSASLTVKVEPSLAEVRVDGELVGSAPLGKALELNPGRHVISISLSGYKTHEEVLELKPKEKREMMIKLIKTKGKVRVTIDRGSIDMSTITVDGKEYYKGSLPVVLDVPAGKRVIGVSNAKTGQHMEEEVFVPDGGSVTVAMMGEPGKPSPQAKDVILSLEVKPESGARTMWQVGLWVGEGFIHKDSNIYRTHATIEGFIGIRFIKAKWLQMEIASLSSVEKPVMVILRPGMRLYLGGLPIFFRVNGQIIVNPERTGGILLGGGGEVPVGGGVSLPLAVDISLWPSAINVMPIEFRLGVAYAF